MRKLWEWLKAWWKSLFAAPAAAFDIDRMVFVRLEVDIAAAELKLEEWGRRNGTAEIPGSDDVEFDGPQDQIIQYVHGHCAETIAEGVARLDTMNGEIERSGLGGVGPRVATAVEDFRAVAERKVEELEASLVEIDRRLQRAAENVAEICRRHGIDRPARHYDHPVRTWALLSGMLLFQAVLNTYFFALGHEWGLAGGLIFALVLAAVDVTLSTGCGFLGRLLFATGRLRVWGGVGIAAGVIWIPVFNLGAAHMREMLQVMPFAEGTRAALVRLLSAPFGLEAIDTWALFFLGGFFSTMAFVGGWTWKDPIPGYGEAQKALDEVELERHEVLDEFRDSLREETEHAREAVKAQRQNADDALDSLKATLATKRTLGRNLRTYVEHVEVSCNALIKRYRDINREHRQTPPPQYFQKRWKYPLPQKLEDDTAADERKLSEQQQLYESLRDRFTEAFEKIERFANEARARVPEAPEVSAPEAPRLQVVPRAAGEAT